MRKDIFGKVVTKKPDFYEIKIAFRDKQRIKDKAERLRILMKYNKYSLVIVGDLELIYAYYELKQCFLDGHYFSIILLSQAFVEKILIGHYTSLGLEQYTTSLSEIINHAKENKVINEYIIRKVDLTRLLRNSITHHKPNTYINTISRRAYENKINFELQAKKDAMAAFEIAMFIAGSDLNRLHK